MLIILLTKDLLIAPQSAFTWQPGGTVMDQFVLPRTAGEMLGVREPTPIKAIACSTSYAFVWRGKAYRALADIPGVPVPLVLSGIAHHDHWQACKACRDGVWCGVGYRLILDEMEGAGVQ
jgi:hypothetical protein